VALSFPGETRGRVAVIAAHLAASLGRDRVLYDRFHEAEFARPNLDVHLQGLYHDHTELLVVLLCRDYERKEWCGLEWRAIRDLIKHRREKIMFLRFDDAPVSGVFSIDGYLDISERSDAEVAALILQRLAQDRGNIFDGAPTIPDEADALAGRTRLVLKEAGTVPNGSTTMCELHLDQGERIRVALTADHELDFAICTAAGYKRWRSNAKLTGSLHQARRTKNMIIQLAAKDTGKHHVLVINNTRRKAPVAYTLQIFDH
jgi:hypothetical protein